MTTFGDFMIGNAVEQDKELRELRQERNRLKDALTNLYDKWENGTPCQEASEGGELIDGTNLGNAVKLTFAEEQEILNLIVDKPEPYEQACANCGKPYRAHLLHNGNKCFPASVECWFPKSIADALTKADVK